MVSADAPEHASSSPTVHPIEGMACLRFAREALMVSCVTLFERSCQFKHLFDSSHDGALYFYDLDERDDGALYHWLLHGDLGSDRYDCSGEDDWLGWLKQLAKYAEWAERREIPELNNIVIDRVYALCLTEYQKLNLPSIARLAPFLTKAPKLYELLVAVLAFLPDVRHQHYLGPNGICSDFTYDVALRFTGRVCQKGWNGLDPEDWRDMDLTEFYQSPHCDVSSSIEPGSWFSQRDESGVMTVATLPPHHTLPMLPEERRTMSKIPPPANVYSLEWKNRTSQTDLPEPPILSALQVSTPALPWTTFPLLSYEATKYTSLNPEAIVPPSPPLLERDSFIDTSSTLHIPPARLTPQFDVPELTLSPTSVASELSDPDFRSWNPSMILPACDYDGKPILENGAHEMRIDTLDGRGECAGGSWNGVSTRALTPDRLTPTDNISAERLPKPMHLPCPRERFWVPNPRSYASPPDSAISVRDGRSLHSLSDRSPSPQPSSTLLGHHLGQTVVPVKANEPPSYLLDPESYCQSGASMMISPKQPAKKRFVDHIGATNIKNAIREKLSGTRNIVSLQWLCRNSDISTSHSWLRHSEPGI